MGLCQGIAHVTSSIELGTAIQPIYLRHSSDLATHAGTIQEISGGRFRLGVGTGEAAAEPHADLGDYQRGGVIGRPISQFSFPQQATVPAGSSAQVFRKLALTWVKMPAGGVACPSALFPQQARVPSARMAQVCSRPALT